jgi:nitrate reductase beta subunit
MAMEWKVAFPLHPEYRTLPMVWYVPPLSPIQSAAEAGKMGIDGGMPDVRSLRIPVRYLANLLTAATREPVAHGAGAHAGHARLHARQDRRRRDRRAVAARVGLTRSRSRRCITSWRSPTTRTASSSRRPPRDAEDAYELRGACGFSFGNGCSRRRQSVLRRQTARQESDGGRVMKTLRALAALLSYPSADLIAAADEIRLVIDGDAILPLAVRGGASSIDR